MPLYRLTTSVIDVLITMVTALLGLRVILKLFGASVQSTVVQGVYGVSEPLLLPFRNVFPSLTLDDGFVLEFSTLFALITYAIFAHVVLTVVRTIAYAVFRRRHVRHMLQKRGA